MNNLTLSQTGLADLAKEGITTPSAIKLVEDLANGAYKIGIKDGYIAGVFVGVVATIVVAGLTTGGYFIFKQIKKNKEEE